MSVHITSELVLPEHLQPLLEELGELIVKALDKVITMEQVVEITSIKSSMIYELSKNQSFPSPIKLSKGRIGWRMSDIQRFIRIGGTDEWRKQNGLK